VRSGSFALLCSEEARDSLRLDVLLLWWDGTGEEWLELNVDFGAGSVSSTFI
jgi:hypothetical protein